MNKFSQPVFQAWGIFLQASSRKSGRPNYSKFGEISLIISKFVLDIMMFDVCFETRAWHTYDRRELETVGSISSLTEWLIGGTCWSST